MSDIFASWDLVRGMGVVISAITPKGTQVFVASSLRLFPILSEKGTRPIKGDWQKAALEPRAAVERGQAAPVCFLKNAMLSQCPKYTPPHAQSPSSLHQF